MPRTRFYNRRFTSRAPVGNTTSGDHLPSALGDPNGNRLRDPSRTWRFRRSVRKTPDHLAVIQPPAATCLTARRRLQVVRRSLALPRDALSRREQETVGALSATGQSRRSGPSDTSRRGRGRQSKPRFFQPSSPVQSAHVNATRLSLARGAFHRRRPLSECPCERALQWRAVPIGLLVLRPRTGAATARAHRCSTKSTTD